MPRFRGEARIVFPPLGKAADELVRALMPHMVKLVGAKADELVPVGRTRKLKQSKKETVQQVGLQGVVKYTARHAHLVHEGTRPHTIKPRKDSGKLRMIAGGHLVFRAEFEHPGAKGQPWLTDALEQSKPAIMAMLESKGQGILDEVLP